MRHILDNQGVTPETPTSGQIEVFSDSSKKLSTVDSTGLKRLLITNTDVAGYEKFRQVTSFADYYHIAGFPYGFSGSLTSAAAGQLSNILACPFTSLRGGTIVELGHRIVTAITNGRFIVGIYNTISDVDLRPNNLLWSSGSLNCASTGVTVTANPNFTPDPTKLYWFASWFSVIGVGAILTAPASNINPMALPFGVSVLSGGIPNGYILSHKASGNYSGLPAAWPAGDTQTYGQNTESPRLFIYRYGS
jgi:hypothetical protein